MSGIVRRLFGGRKDRGGDDDAEEGGKKMKKTASDWKVLVTILKYLWPEGEWLVRFCVVVSFTCLGLSKLFNVMTPFAYKHAVDALTGEGNGSPFGGDGDDAAGDGDEPNSSNVYFPVGWILLYGLLRFLAKSMGDFRDTVFVRVTQNTLKTVALATFQHLHGLSLRYHLHRQTGTVLRAIERGTQGISFLMTFSLFNIVPTLLEIGLVCIIFFVLYEVWFALITLVVMAIYIAFTLTVTNWRIKIRRDMNDRNNDANNRAVDSLINFETVKYFNNEGHEVRRYEKALSQYRDSAVKSQWSLSLLNIGQSVTISAGVVSVMMLAAWRVYQGTMTTGDFVLVNTYLLQLYVPLNFLGTSFRLIKSSLVDLENMFTVLEEKMEIVDDPDATNLNVFEGVVSFSDVTFSYDESFTEDTVRELELRKDFGPREGGKEAAPPSYFLAPDDDDDDGEAAGGGGSSDVPPIVLDRISFTVPAGHMVAIVGKTGAGKSTISRLLFRFYDVPGGNIYIDGQDIRHVTQSSLRRNIGIVPQDTVLFNDTIRYNIAYGDLDCTDADIIRAAKAAQIHDFITGLPDGYDTEVGERGLRLSGGEKQRVAIARAILKNPPIMVFDEATSALDSKTEKQIQDALGEVGKGRTTIVVAHRLSTIMDADEILVLRDHHIVERGTFRQLLEQRGEFFELWMEQQQEGTVPDAEQVIADLAASAGDDSSSSLRRRPSPSTTVVDVDVASGSPAVAPFSLTDDDDDDDGSSAGSDDVLIDVSDSKPPGSSQEMSFF